MPNPNASLIARCKAQGLIHTEAEHLKHQESVRTEEYRRREESERRLVEKFKFIVSHKNFT